MLKRLSQGLRTVFAVAILTVATYAVAQEFRGDHPDTYVVKRGDTLWDIAGRFLKRPWLWPEIWQANPQVRNPHLIYPGDVLSLAYLDRVAMQPGPRQEAAPINAIPLSDVEAFLKDLRVVDQFDQLPYVVGLEGDRMRSAQGQVAYIKGLPTARAGERYLVVRPTVRYTRLDRTSMCCDLMWKDDLDERGRRDIDFHQYWTNVVMPDKGHELLGFELMRVSVGTVTRGEVGGIEASTLLLDEQGREVRVGDRLIAIDAQPYDLQFFPHPPKQQLDYGTAR
ncbi:MAG: LysM peptidoglycan-binding domain-containing protein, partial [Luteimonas sp.]|nr:LysM peptidoglycan-binding domain-containing protein [Luteimonas sp.]